MNKEFTTKWFNGRRIHFEKALKHLKPASELRFLEIGCWEGQATTWLAENFPHALIEVVDTFGGNPEHIEKGMYNLETLEDRFCANTHDFADRLVVNVGKSVDILPALWKNNYDFIYVDGSHAAPDVLFDAVLSWQLLKKGGVMALDDYTWRQDRPETDTPKIAIDLFTRVYAREMEWLHKGSAVILRKL